MVQACTGQKARPPHFQNNLSEKRWGVAQLDPEKRKAKECLPDRKLTGAIPLPPPPRPSPCPLWG
jgi:hypothetical protein